MQSIALPTKIGAYSVRPTVTAAKTLIKLKIFIFSDIGENFFKVPLFSFINH